MNIIITVIYIYKYIRVNRVVNSVKTVLNTLLSVELCIRRYNEETKFSVTPSFVLAHSSDSISDILSDECASTKLGVTENFVSSLYLLIQIYI